MDEGSEADPSRRLSSTSGNEDSWPTSDNDNFNFDTKNVVKPSLAKLTAAQQSKKNIEAKYAIVRPENRTLYKDNNFHSGNEDVFENLPNTLKKSRAFLILPSHHPNLFFKSSCLQQSLVLQRKKQQSQ